MDKKEIQELLSSKEEYIEKLKIELYHVSGQITLLKEMLEKLKTKKEPPKK